MPRIAVAIFVVVAVSVSIGINIARYPAVFVVAGSTDESLVSDDTKDVPEAKETEGPVAVNALPALPDEDLAKWNPPMVNEVKPTVTEEVPHMASHSEYTVGYGGAESTRSPAEESAPETTPSGNENVSGVAPAPSEASMPEPRSDVSAEAAVPSSNEIGSGLNHYEVEPNEPYTEDRGEVREEKKENVGDRGQESSIGSSAGDSIWDRPLLGDSSVGSASSEVASVPNNAAPVTSYKPTEKERPIPGAWPATVAESFQYKQAVHSQVPRSAASPVDEQESHVEVRNVSSSDVTASDSDEPSVQEPLHQTDSAMIYEEESDWEASVPMVAIRDTSTSLKQASDEVPSVPQVKRLPEVKGADVLPGALPPLHPVSYPVTR